MNLPPTWLNTASNGVKTLAGLWQGTAIGSGQTSCFRIYDSAQTQCHLQGSVSGAGGGGDMTVDNTSIVPGQVITINSMTLVEANA
jgi:hypothetical protein